MHEISKFVVSVGVFTGMAIGVLVYLGNRDPVVVGYDRPSGCAVGIHHAVRVWFVGVEPIAPIIGQIVRSGQRCSRVGYAVSVGINVCYRL